MWMNLLQSCIWALSPPFYALRLLQSSACYQSSSSNLTCLSPPSDLPPPIPPHACMQLLNHGADVRTAIPATGDTPLHLACEGGWSTVVDLLLDRECVESEGMDEWNEDKE